ncbi:hypothetical protein ACQB6R_02295 [Propionibacteriaceae bacterium G1746]
MAPTSSARPKDLRLMVGLVLFFVVTLLGLWITYRVSFAIGVMTHDDTIMRTGQVQQVADCGPGYIASRSCAADVSWDDGSRTRERVWAASDVKAGDAVTEHPWRFGRFLGHVVAPTSHPADGSIGIFGLGAALSALAGLASAFALGRLWRHPDALSRSSIN